MWIITGIVILTVFAAGIYIFLGKNVKEYKKTEEVFGNPLMGYAPCAWNNKISMTGKALKRIISSPDGIRKENISY